MREDEWLKTTDPVSILNFVGSRAHRKLRLFAVAYCRRIWSILDDPAYRKAVVVAEQYADGSADADQLKAAWSDAREVNCSRLPSRYDNRSGLFLFDDSRPDSLHHAQGEAAVRAACVDDRLWFMIFRTGPLLAVRRHLPQEAVAECDLLRDLFGPLPFRAITINSSWLIWNDATIPTMAQAIYDDRRFDNLPILADALEEAGCSDIDILGHCRGPGPHVRGCWVVDLLLSKE